MTGADDIDTTVAYIARHVQDGTAPTCTWYEATSGAAGCRSLGYLSRHYGMRWNDLLRRAGATPRMEFPNRRPRTEAVPADVEAHVQAEQAHRTGWRDPHGRTWLGTPDGWYSPTLPVCAIREESYTGRTPDGTPVAVSRIYYSLR